MDSQEEAAIRLALSDNNTYRLRQLAERKKLQDRLTPTTFYLGQSDDGRSLVKPLGGAITPLQTIGNVQGSMGTVGRAAGGSFDTGAQTFPQQRNPTSEKVGKIKILVDVDRGDTQIEYWVGGHVKTPVLIKKFGTNILPYIARLDNTGTGKNDWIFAYKHSATEDLDTIGVIYGATPDLNWEITSREAKALFTTGNGFWSSVGQFVNGTFATTDPINQQGPLIGTWVCTNLGALGTCQSYTLSGPSITETTTGQTSSGLTEPSATIFPGTTNTFLFSVLDRQYWDGTYGGGSEPSVPDAYFAGIALAEYCGQNYPWEEDIDAMIVLERETRIDRVISSPAYTYSAYQNVALTNSGQFNLEKLSYRYQRFEQSHPTYIGHLITGLQTGSVEAACRLTKVPVDGGPLRTVPGLITQNGSASILRSVQIPIAPAVTKPLTFSASDSTASGFGIDFAPYTSVVHSPIQNAAGTYFFRKDESSGIALIGQNGESIASTATSSITYYLFDTAERAVTLPVGTDPFSYRLKPTADAPTKLAQVNTASIGAVFQTSVTGTVILLTDGGTGTFALVDPLQEKVYKIPFSQDIASIIDADYYG
jgi:hypothetical protein